MADNRFSNIDITQIKKPVVLVGSKEDYYLAPDAAIRVFSNSTIAGQGAGGSFSPAGGTSAGGTGPGSITASDRPQLADIHLISHSTYYDSQQKKVRAKMVITMRNSSGKNILGMDARITIPSSAGGN